MSPAAPPAAIDRQVRAAARWAVVIALVVLVLRLGAYGLTRSAAVLADAVDPVINLLAAGVTLAGVVFSRRPADPEHPFGHRKMEYVVAGFNGLVVLSGAAVVAVAAWWQFSARVPVRPTGAAIALLLGSVVLNAWLGRHLLAVGTAHGSPALRSAGRHARSDVLLGLAVVVDLVVVGLSGWRWLDPLVSVVIVLTIAWTGFWLFTRAGRGLMDNLPSELRERVLTVLRDCVHPPVIGFHDLRCRDSGGHAFADFHLQFAEGTSLPEAHDLAEAIEERVQQALGSADATAHLEPHDQLRDDATPVLRAVSPRERARRRAANTSLVVAVALVAIKFVAAVVTGSAAVLSDAIEGLVNIAAAGFAIVSVRRARRSADASHPYGHYKIEFLAAILEGSLIILAALAILAAAVPRFVRPAAVTDLDLGLALLFVAGAANFALGWYLLNTGRRLHSLTLEADGRHVMTDVVTSGGVLLGLLLVRLTGWAVLDPLVAAAVALVILVAGTRLVTRAIGGVIDTVDPVTHDRAAGVLARFAANGLVVGWHQLRVRDLGSFRFIDAHIQAPEGATLAEAHEVAEVIESALEDELAPAHAIIHAEPASEVREG